MKGLNEIIDKNKKTNVDKTQVKIDVDKLEQYMTDLFAHSDFVCNNTEIVNTAFNELKEFIKNVQNNKE